MCLMSRPDITLENTKLLCVLIYVLSRRRSDAGGASSRHLHSNWKQFLCFYLTRITFMYLIHTCLIYSPDITVLADWA